MHPSHSYDSVGDYAEHHLSQTSQARNQVRTVLLWWAQWLIDVEQRWVLHVDTVDLDHSRTMRVTFFVKASPRWPELVGTAVDIDFDDTKLLFGQSNHILDQLFDAKRRLVTTLEAEVL